MKSTQMFKCQISGGREVERAEVNCQSFILNWISPFAFEVLPTYLMNLPGMQAC